MLRFFLILPICLFGFGRSPQEELYFCYEDAVTIQSDIYEHVPFIRELASECNSAVELGMRGMISTWGILHGLADHGGAEPFYLGVDPARPCYAPFMVAQRLASELGIQFAFLRENDMNVVIPTVDFLMIDSFHIYSHLMYELEVFSPFVSKYIVMHDTSAPWGYYDEPYEGDYSEYPAHIDREKRGLWTAVKDFLDGHPEWILFDRKINCHGLTVLKRVED
jgi:hypothetical protein